MWKRTLGLVLAATATAAAPSCSCDDDGEDGASGLDSAANGSQSGSAQGGASGQGGSGGDTTTPTVTVGGLGGDEPSGQGGQGGACADITINFAPIIPSVMLLIDQSGSMTEDFGDDGNRWDVLYETLMDPGFGVVTNLQSQVRFGMALYTGTEDEEDCPGITDVPIAIDNRDAIDAVYAPEGPEGDTPTGDAITSVTPGVVAFAEEGPKFIVLCTDGEPDTCEDGDADGRPESLAAAQATFGMGIGIYVISVGSDVGEDHLQDMANAGVGLPIGGPEDAPFWQALDAEGLAEAFDTIINGVRSCVLTVDGEIDPDKACDGTVRIDGVEIPCDDPNGWKLNSPTEIELQGDACDLIQSGEHTVDATFPCEAAETSSTGVPPDFLAKKVKVATMAVLDILHVGNPLLRERSRELTREELVSAETQSFIDDLVETMRAANGAGIAAPQVGRTIRVCAIEVKDNPRYPYKPNIPLTILVNPVLEAVGDETFDNYEGCLSVPNLRGVVKRAAVVKLRAWDREGREVAREIRGLTAGTFQHEADHLDGKLFLDRVEDPSTLATWAEFDRFHKAAFIERIVPFIARMGG